MCIPSTYLAVLFTSDGDIPMQSFGSGKTSRTCSDPYPLTHPCLLQKVKGEPERSLERQREREEKVVVTFKFEISHKKFQAL